MIACDGRRQANVEALAQFRRDDKVEAQPWTCFGNFFIRLPAPLVQERIQRGAFLFSAAQMSKVKWS